MQHIIAVLTVLHPQAEPELGVAPDVVVYGSAGLLGREDQVYAQAPAHLRHADQLFHKFRLFPLQLCKLINDDKQMRHGNRSLAVFIQLCI